MEWEYLQKLYVFYQANYIEPTNGVYAPKNFQINKIHFKKSRRYHAW